MSSAGDERADMAAKLVAAGLPATCDPATVAPMILVDAAVYVAASGVGAWRVDIAVRPVVPPPGDADALAALESYVEATFAVLGFAPAVPEAWSPNPTTPTPNPAYRITYARTVPNPAC